MAVEWDRRVIPRWRNSSFSSLLPETRPINQVGLFKKLHGDKANLENLLKVWRNKPDLGGAVDLLNFTHNAEFKELLTDPAHYLLSGGFQLPEQLVILSNQILNASTISLVGELNLEGECTESFIKEASILKNRLFIDPRNSIALVDLARAYAALGQNEKAKLTLSKAAYLKPNHRFILRASARFMVHNNQSEEAIGLLNKSPSTLIDPWLMATHISLETIIGKTPRLLKKANSLIESGKFSPFHLTELSSSIATVQAFDGDFKKAKRHFNNALISPNDNVVAQAIWASQKFDLTIRVRDEWLTNPFSHEARYYQYILDANFEAAIAEAKDWFIDEPFTARPIRAAAYICCVLGHYETAEKYILQALKIDKSDIESNNNLVFALAAQNKITDAYIKLTEITKAELSIYGSNQGHTLANWGMILFKSGNFEEGEKCYKAALAKFDHDKNYFSLSQAAAYMARESVLSKSPRSSILLQEAIDILKKHPSKIATKILSMSKLIEERNDKISNKLIDNWQYDPEKKLLIINKSLPFKV